MTKIALLTYPYLLPFFEETVSPIRSRCQIDLLSFERQHQLLNLIPALSDQYDGFCVTSALAEKFLRQAVLSINKPVLFLDKNSVNFYKSFFLILNENRDANLSRILFDTSLIRLESVRSMSDLIKNIELLEDNRTSHTNDLRLDEFINMEAQIEATAVDMWRKSQYDLIVCRFANVASLMEREHIPHIFIYPEKYRVLDILEDLIGQIHAGKQIEGLPASIVVFPVNTSQREFQEISEESIRIQKALLEFSKNYASHFTVQYLAQGYEILTSHFTIQQITGNFTGCHLSYYLFSTQGINARVGYGIGRDISGARHNAFAAKKAAETSGMSCVMTEDGHAAFLQIKPASPEAPCQYNSVINAAGKTGLSPSTVQRIRSALQFLRTDEITNHGLAEALQVTVANANRFLNVLVRSGNAEVTGMKKGLTKGRPSRIYRIRL